MQPALPMEFAVDRENRQIRIKKIFLAPRETVWNAWTSREILDTWWAPKPWRAETDEMELRNGGRWLYSMNGPDGEKHYCRTDFITINEPHSIIAKDGFCDDQGNFKTDMPLLTWDISFADKNEHTLVSIEFGFETLEELDLILEMGFQQGFSATLENLDILIDDGRDKTRHSS